MESIPVWLSTFILGFGTVFVGLICLIYITKMLSYLCRKPKKAQKPAAALRGASGEDAQDRSAFVAAVSAAIATAMGESVSGIRIHSIKKLHSI